jgi:hypothetical protein
LLTLQALRDPDTGVVTHDRRVDHQLVRGVFSGLDAADWFVTNMHGVSTLDEAQAVGQKFLALGLLSPVNCGSLFEPTEQVCVCVCVCVCACVCMHVCVCVCVCVCGDGRAFKPPVPRMRFIDHH